jgi:hypothetical protein
MATPPGPASPGNPISFDDLRSQPYITPNTDIGLELMGTYKFDDGYINSYTFYINNYPPNTPPYPDIKANLSIGDFYDNETDQGTDCLWNGTSIGWVTDVIVTAQDVTNLYAGGNDGPNAVTTPLTIANFAGTPATIGNNIEHWYAVLISVNVVGMQPPSPPNPPSNDVNVEYDIGGGWVQFFGSPSNAGGFFNETLNVPNGQTLFVRVS